MKVSRLMFAAAISFNLFVLTCTLIGRGHALQSGRDPSSTGASFQIFRSRIQSGKTLSLRGRSEVFPFVLAFQDSPEMDASEVQPGSDSGMWMNIPFQSSSATEIVYVRMTREQFARFEKAGVLGIELTSAEGKRQHAYLQMADATDSKSHYGSTVSPTQIDGNQDHGAGQANESAAVSATSMSAVLVEAITQDTTERPPSVRFVQVAPDVKLEVLDWGARDGRWCCSLG